MADGAAGVAALARAPGLVLGATQLEAIDHYVDLLQRWNATYNLTSVRGRAAILTQHIADCLAVVPPVQRHCIAGRLLDVGSGAGLPGVVLAIALPKLQVTCVDAVGKKAAFVRQVAGLLKLNNLSSQQARVESLRAPGFDIVTSRAFASLGDFTRLTRHLLAPHGVWLAMKGRLPSDEIEALPAEVEVFHVEQLIVPQLDAQRCLLWMRPKAAAPAN